MGKYMFHATYTQSGLTGLLKEGGTRRREALTATIEGMGGSVEELMPIVGHMAPSQTRLVSSMARR